MTNGEIVRLYREKLGLTQTELAKLCGYKEKSSISKIEKSERELTLQTMKILSDVLGIPLDDFIYNNYSDTKCEQPQVIVNKIIEGEILSFQEKKVINAWRILSERDRKIVAQLIERLAKEKVDI